MFPIAGQTAGPNGLKLIEAKKINFFKISYEYNT